MINTNDRATESRNQKENLLVENHLSGESFDIDMANGELRLHLGRSLGAGFALLGFLAVLVVLKVEADLRHTVYSTA